MTVSDLREAVALLNAARPSAAEPADRRKWGRRRNALRARLREWEDLPYRVAAASGRKVARRREPEPDLIVTTSKRERMRLAKSELWLHLAVVASYYLADDVVDEIAAVYGLTGTDLDRLRTQLGAELEGRAERAGYEHAWL